MKKILIAIIALFVALSSCTKEYSREISKSQKFHLGYMPMNHGSTVFVNGETSFSVRAVNSNCPEQQYIAEFLCNKYNDEGEVIIKYYCREYGTFEEVKENMLDNLCTMEYHNYGTDIYGNRYIWLPGNREVSGQYVFSKYGQGVMICHSVSGYIECLRKLN